MRDLAVVADSTVADQVLLDLVVRLGREAVARRGQFVMALSGGNSPLPFYRLLAATDFPWQQTDVWIVDERFVPPGHPDHNGSAIRACLPQARLHLINTNAESCGLAAAGYAAELSELPVREGWPQFDFILLGMGADGHTASLFPGTGAAKVKDKTAVAVTPLAAAHERISLTLPVLNAARVVVVFVGGESKREMLSKVLHGSNPELPASLLNPTEGRVIFLGDSLSCPLEKPLEDLQIKLS